MDVQTSRSLKSTAIKFFSFSQTKKNFFNFTKKIDAEVREERDPYGQESEMSSTKDDAKLLNRVNQRPNVPPLNKIVFFARCDHQQPAASTARSLNDRVNDECMYCETN